jgi:serine/threonine-protein kinase
MNPPRLISRYEVKGLIARGGMGDLHLARDPNTNRLVVVKLLSATLESSDIRERFEREARSLASLSHPNIVQIYDYGELDDTPFIVIEYVRGETLGERIKRRAPMSVALKLKLLAELCGGLANAHAAGIIHRDVKPGNLMVDQHDRLKILDFGIARVADSSLTRFGVLASQLVMQIGTPGYMSPEQVQGAEIDARSDIFAAGAVCYALLAYRDPFTGKNPDEIERSVMVSSQVPLTSLVPDLDPEVVSIVTRALAKSREQRYPDAATMGAALERSRQRLAQMETLSPPARQVKAGAPPQTADQRAGAL